jgi:hypothetical protein
MLIIIARVVITGLWIWAGFKIAGSGADGATVGSQATLFYLSIILLLTLPMAVVWTPYLVEGLFGSLADSMNDDHADPEKLRLARWIRRAEARKRRRLVVLLCWWEGVMVHPNLQRPFFTGMKHAKPGSFLERFFAQEVLRFGDSRNVMQALNVLDHHGIKPKSHWSESITEMMRFRKLRVKPAPPAMPVPKTDAPAAPKRNPRIKLFSSADQNPSMPPAPPPVVEPTGSIIDPAELGREAGKIPPGVTSRHRSRR